MHTPHPNDYIWQEIYTITSQLELTLQAFATFVQWFTVAAAGLLAGILVVMLCAKGWERYVRRAHRPVLWPAAAILFVVLVATALAAG